jgi:hypothetical protein
MRTSEHVLSHWHRLIEDHQASALQFYDAVQAVLVARQVPHTVQSKVIFKESGVMSANREYVRILRGTYAFDICAAPFGTGYFYSWWLSEVEATNGVLWFLGVLAALFFTTLIVGAMSVTFGIIFALFGIPSLLVAGGVAVRENYRHVEPVVISMPLFGKAYRRFINPTTFYTYDTALMFQDAVHNAVVEVIDKSLCAQGLRALAADERKPVNGAFAATA